MYWKQPGMFLVGIIGLIQQFLTWLRPLMVPVWAPAGLDHVHSVVNTVNAGGQFALATSPKLSSKSK